MGIVFGDELNLFSQEN